METDNMMICDLYKKPIQVISNSTKYRNTYLVIPAENLLINTVENIKEVVYVIACENNCYSEFSI